MFSRAAVHSAWFVYIALPSPISATTGRSGNPSFTPIAAGRPQPMPPPRMPKKLLGSAHLKNVRMPFEDEIASSTTTASSGVAFATACTSDSGEIGNCLASISARLAISVRSAACAAVSDSRRVAASLCPAFVVSRRKASHKSGSVAFGSPWMPTAAG